MLKRNNNQSRITRKSLPDKVFNHMYRAIKSGSYAPDERLPSETNLAAELKVSRPIVREALKKLREQNLIYSRQGVGSFVRQNGIKDPLGFGSVENLSDLRKCYEFREVLEPAGAALAAQRHSQADLNLIETALNLLKDATAQHRHREDVDYDFHLAISLASGNQYFLTAMESLKEHIAVGMKYHGISLKQSSRGLEDVFTEHDQIFNAIKSRDEDLAYALMKKHITGSRTRLFD